MSNRKTLMAVLAGLVIMGCGPETIFVRPSLDTPAQHVANGQQLLDQKKIEDACREFNRARELDPQFIGAYIGLGVASGLKGDFQSGFAIMDHAKQMAADDQQLSAVRQGYEQLVRIQHQQNQQTGSQGK
jgi:hypothetical protein